MGSRSSWNEQQTENIVRWISIAIRDRGAAYHVFHGGYLENAVYNLQQASEKLLKAFLVANDIAIEKTHNIDTLLVSAGRIDHRILEMQDIGIGSATVSKFATRYRYPNWEKNDFAEADEILQTAEFSDALYAYLAPYFGAEILDKALAYARVKSNPFEENIAGTEEGDILNSRPKI